MHTIESHCSEQIIGVSTTHGYVLLLQLKDIDGLQLLGTYHLCSVQIEAIRFVESSMSLFALDAERTLFHIVMDTYDVSDIKGLIQYESQIRDVSVKYYNAAMHILSLCYDEPMCYGCAYQIDQTTIECCVPMKYSLKYRYSSMQFILSERIVGCRMASKTQTIDVYDVQLVGDELRLTELQSIETLHICENIRFVCHAASVLVTLGNDGKLIEWQADTVSLIQSTVIFDTIPKESVIDIACCKR